MRARHFFILVIRVCQRPAMSRSPAVRLSDQAFPVRVRSLDQRISHGNLFSSFYLYDSSTVLSVISAKKGRLFQLIPAHVPGRPNPVETFLVDMDR